MGSTGEKQPSGLPVNDQSARPWTAAFTSELAVSLIACPSMDDPQSRSLFLKRVGERLQMPGPFMVENHSVPRDHIYAIVYACKDYKEPGAAVTALAAAMEDLHPDSRALARLHECDAALRGLTALSTDQLVSVLNVIADLAGKYGYADAYELARRASFGQILPLRGTEDLPGIVRRLNGAREIMPARAPLVVRFLAVLANSLEGNDRSRLGTELERIADELGLSPGYIRIDSLESVHRAPERTVLQIRIIDVSPLGSPSRYAIDAAVFDLFPGRRERIGSWRFDSDCSSQGIDDAGRRFLERANGLSSAAGTGADTTVEFILPWSLLSHPVERWGLDEEGYWIGYRFPVVVRSLDRQHNMWYFEPWLKRWEMLVSDDDGRSIGERIGWLHYGNTVVPEHAGNAGRIIHLTGGRDLTRWLARAENRSTAALGLTFPYRPDDPVCLNGIKDAIRQGIPLLVWCRENSDASKLERLLETVQLRDLRDTVRRWRCLTADGQASARDGLHDIVLLLDDPGDISNPFDRHFVSPHYM